MADFPDLSGNMNPVTLRVLAELPAEIAAGVYQASPVTLLDGQTGRLRVTDSGALVVDVLDSSFTVSGPMTSAEFLANLRSTAAFTSVNSTNASTNILAANANRKGAVIVNTDANILYLDLSGGTAATTRYAAALSTGEEYEVPFGVTGLITGIWAADGSGAALVTEFS